MPADAVFFLHSLAIIVVFLARSASGELFTISDTSYPHVFISDPANVAVVWHRKLFAFRLAHSSAIRINARGVRFVPLSHTLHISLEGSVQSLDMQEFMAKEALKQLQLMSFMMDTKNSSGSNAMQQSNAAITRWWQDEMVHDHIHADGNVVSANNGDAAAASAGYYYATNRWRSTPCIPARDSLCHLRSAKKEDMGSANSLPTPQKFVSRLFPNYPQQVFLTQRDTSLLPEDVARMLMGSNGAMTCPEMATGRTAISPLEFPHAVPQHDISLCNVVGMGADYLFVPFQSRLYVLIDPIGIQSLILLSILIIVMMVIMGHNLQVVLGDALTSAAMATEAAGPSQAKGAQQPTQANPQQQHQHEDDSIDNDEDSRQGYKWAVGGMLLIVLTSLFATAFNTVGGNSGDMTSFGLQVVLNAFSLSCFVTYEDKAAFVATCVYVIYYCIRIQGNAWWGNRKTTKPINPVLASITVAVQRIYTTADNPYTPTTTFLMLTWTLHKISTFERNAVVYGSTGGGGSQFAWARALDILLDCFLLSMLLYTGVVIQLENDPAITAIQALQGLLAAVTLNRALLAVHFPSRQQ